MFKNGIAERIMNIQFVSGEDIDQIKWDSCVHYASNGNVFGYKWFLDNVAKEWDGLIEGDYESVFPLVHRDGLLNSRELYQPLMMRELGIFSIHVLSQRRIKAFLEAIPGDYRRIDIVLNEQNRPQEVEDFSIRKKTNYQLPLHAPYEVIRAGYGRVLADRLETARDRTLLPVSNLQPEAVAEFYKQHTSDPKKDRTYNFHALQRIMYNVLHRGRGFATGVRFEGGDLCAINFFIYSHGRLLSLIPIESDAGRREDALGFLLDMIIRTHAQRPLILDFNASGEDTRYQEFGATPNAFYQLQRDRRKWWRLEV